MVGSGRVTADTLALQSVQCEVFTKGRCVVYNTRSLPMTAGADGGGGGDTRENNSGRGQIL